MSNSFGVAIPVNGPNNGFPGSPSRMGDRDIVSRIVAATATVAGLPFGSGAVEISNATGGAWLSLADFLATATNAALLAQQFAGIAVRNVKTQLQYVPSLLQSTGTTVVSTTGTGSINTTALTVASATGIVVGMSVEGAGIASGTVVTAISGTTITLSQNMTAALSTTTVAFTQTLPQGVVGFFAAGQQADVRLRGSILVQINPGATGSGPQANLPVYIRTVANASYPGTSVGDFEANPDAGPTTTGTATAGTASLTVASATNIAVGQMVTGVGIANNTFVTAISGTTITLSQNTTLALSTTAVAFFNTALLGTTVDPWIVFRTGVVDPNNIAEVTIKNRHAA